MSFLETLWIVVSAVFAMVVGAKLYSSLKAKHGEPAWVLIVSFAVAMGIGYSLTALLN